MPSRRRTSSGLLRLPYSKSKFKEVRSRLGLKTAQKLAKSGQLFYQPVENAVRKSQSESSSPGVISLQSASPSKEISRIHEPMFVQISSKLVGQRYRSSLHEGTPLFQFRPSLEGKQKIRRFRSRAFQRQSNARLLNRQLRPIALLRQNLAWKLNQLSKDFKVNNFVDVAELHKHIPILKKMAELRLEFVKVNIRMAEKKLDYYDRFPSRQNKSIVAKIEKGLYDLEKLADTLSRQKNALNDIKGDLRLMTTQLNIRQKLGVELTRQLMLENNAPENPTGQQLSNVLKLTHLREQFHTARVNQFEAEMKLFHLYGVLFSGRTEASIKKDVVAAQEKVMEAVIKRRRLSKDE